MKTFISFLLILGCAALTQAAAPSDSSINELMNAMRLETMLNQAVKQVDEGMSKGMEQRLQSVLQGKELNIEQKLAVEKFRTKFSQIVRDELSYAKVKSIYFQSYRETFTQEEVDAITAFYRSPAGKAMTEKYPAIMQKANTLMQARIGPMAAKMDVLFQDFAKELSDKR